MAFPDARGIAWTVIQIQVILVSAIGVVGASYCSEEQIVNCKTSGQEGSLNKLAGGGECQPKQYVQFTHLCIVNNYVPSIDYCCCANERRILCCKYHNDWNYFRCAEAEDVIDTIPDDMLPREFLLTAILVPTAAVLFTVVCCVRCLCCHDDEDESCRCLKCRPCRDKDSSDKRSIRRSKRYEDVQTPLKTQYKDAKMPLPDDKYSHASGIMFKSSIGNGSAPSVPSAPPPEDPAFAQLLPRSQVITGQNYAAGASQNNNSNSSGFMLHYVPLQHGQTPPNTVIECPYQDLHHKNNTHPSDNTYRYSGTLNCCHGNPAQSQTLIGILTNPDGRPILADATSPPPRDPPPAYEDASSENVKAPLPVDRESSTTSGC